MPGGVGRTGGGEDGEDGEDLELVERSGAEVESEGLG